MNEPPFITVIICTRRRPGSLGLTLADLAATRREGLAIEVVVVENDSEPRCASVVEPFRAAYPVRHLLEPTLGVSGKSHCLNRALEEVRPESIVAVMDDDIGPHRDWFEGVDRLCRRWPDRDLFAGKTYVIWPAGTIPAWAKHPRIRSWAYSVMDWGDQDRPLPPGGWFAGGCFWFRARVLESGRRFKDQWLTEPEFMLGLAEDGYQGVYGPDAVAGHRVQFELLERETILERAQKVGRSFAQVRLDPRFSRVRQVRLFKRHPWAGRAFCLLGRLHWTTRYLLATLSRASDSGFVRKVCALERAMAYREYPRVARQHAAYSLWRGAHL